MTLEFCLEFTVYGTPQPKGSTRAFIPRGWKRPIVTDNNPKGKPWAQQISATALAEMEERGLDTPTGPVSVYCRFYFARPKSTKSSVIKKITRPDIDKLARNVLDSLTGIAFKDDAQVCLCGLSKSFGDPERVVIVVYWEGQVEPVSDHR